MFEQSWTGVYQNIDTTGTVSTSIGETDSVYPDSSEYEIYPKIKRPISFPFITKEFDACVSLTEPCGQLTVPVDLVQVLNEKASTVESPRILTPIQAYELALNTLKTFETKWEAYVKEEARLLSIFDEDED
jgi:hypothetical protein